MARSDGDISARGMTIVYALRRPLLELANEFAEEATTYFMELLQDRQTSKDVLQRRRVPWTPSRCVLTSSK